MLKKALSGMILTIFMLPLFSGNAAADAGAVGDYLFDSGKQIGRGFVNVVTSLGEIPCTAIAESGEYGDGAWPGMAQGTMDMFERLIIGVVEVGTFIMPRDAIIDPIDCSPKNSASVS